VGFHLGHRETRDLDLFWRSRGELGELVADALGALRSDGLEAQVLRTAPAFAELRVTDGSSTCIVDLVAEPFPAVEAPVRADIEGATIAVDSRRELLASKLATLLELPGSDALSPLPGPSRARVAEGLQGGRGPWGREPDRAGVAPPGRRPEARTAARDETGTLARRTVSWAE
jgi:hypothetical protein